MTGQKIFDALPKEVQDKIKRNMKEMSPNRYNNFLFEDYLNERGFIGRLFVWCESPEGEAYWHHIAMGDFKNLKDYDRSNAGGLGESIPD